jgi:hypothetical protein
VRIAAGTSGQVLVDQDVTGILHGGSEGPARVTVRNANRFPVAIELPIGRAGQTITAAGQALAEVDGVMTWRVQLAANGTATLDYRYR